METPGSYGLCERRGASRIALNGSVRVATATGQPMPPAELVDASMTGVLIVLVEPFGFARHARVCVSLPTGAGLVHLLGAVRRVERRDDFRTYVALELADGGHGHEIDEWHEWLAEQAGQPVAVAAA